MYGAGINTISHDMEIRVDQAVESFMKGIDQMLLEEQLPKTQWDFSQKSEPWQLPEGEGHWVN